MDRNYDGLVRLAFRATLSWIGLRDVDALVLGSVTSTFGESPVCFRVEQGGCSLLLIAWVSRVHSCKLVKERLVDEACVDVWSRNSLLVFNVLTR